MAGMATSGQVREAARSDAAVPAAMPDCSRWPVTSVWALNSQVAIGNRVEFSGDVVILPTNNGFSTQAAADVISDFRAGNVEAAPLKPDSNGNQDGYSRCRRRNIAIFTVATILTSTVMYFIISFWMTDICSGDLVRRKQWSDRAPSCATPRLKEKPSLVVVYQTEEEVCQTCSKCVKQARMLQARTQKSQSRETVRPKPTCQIPYNFLIGGTGDVFEGAGFENEGEVGSSYPNLTLSLAFMGTFYSRHPPSIQLDKAQEFLERTAERGALRHDFKVAAALQILKNDSPGCQLFADLKLWKRWTHHPLEWLNVTRNPNETNENLCDSTTRLDK